MGKYNNSNDINDKIEKKKLVSPSKNRKKISSLNRIQLIIGGVILLFAFVFYPAYGWFKMQREIARLERIKSPDVLFITAAHREDTINLVMDDITVDGKWVDSLGNEENATYQDYVFSVAGEYTESYTLQLTHTTNNPYKYEIFEADPSGGVPAQGEIKGKDYVRYKVTFNYPQGLANMDDNENTRIIDEGTDKVIYYRLRKVGGLPVTLNQTLKINPETGIPIETNTYTYRIGNRDRTITFNGHYLNLAQDGRTATEAYNSYTYQPYEYKDQYVQPLYWQCTNVPGSDGTSKNAFYHEYILRIYFNNATTTYKDTDIIYLTVLGNN